MRRGTKRFYTRAAIVPLASAFHVFVDSRPVRTPAGKALALPTAALAAAVANEWLGQDEDVRPETMPLTRLAATAIDRIGTYREGVIDALMAYVDSDMICYRAADPPELVRLQIRLWQPLVEWASAICGARMAVCTGVLPLVQPQPVVAGLRALLETTSAPQLAALATIVPASGSLVIGLALLRGRLEAGAAVEAALLDERWQAAQWGTDAEAEARRAAIADDIASAVLFLRLAGLPAASGQGVNLQDPSSPLSCGGQDNGATVQAGPR